jgi:hypothetical protein
MQSPSPESDLSLYRRRYSTGLLLLAGVLVCLIGAASWAPGSRMSELRWVPAWVAAEADQHPNLRTGIPFIPLAFMLTYGLASRGLKRPRILAMGFCVACLGSVEAGQLLLPERTADAKDLAWGMAGIFLGLALTSLPWKKPRPPKQSNL